MILRRTAVSTFALLASVPAMADVVELEPIIVTQETGDAFFGKSVSLDTGTVAKTGDAIAETPRSVTVVTAQELAEQIGRAHV